MSRRDCSGTAHSATASAEHKSPPSRCSPDKCPSSRRCHSPEKRSQARLSPADASPPTCPPYAPSGSRSAPLQCVQTMRRRSHLRPAEERRAKKAQPESPPAKSAAGTRKKGNGVTAGPLPEQYQITRPLAQPRVG